MLFGGGSSLLRFHKKRQERLWLKGDLWSIRVMMNFRESRLQQSNMMNKLDAIKYVSVYGRKEILLRMR